MLQEVVSSMFFQGSNDLFTFTDSDSNPIPVLRSWDGSLNPTPSIGEMFCMLQCSHLVCSLNPSQYLDPAM